MMMELAFKVAIGGHFLGKQCRQGKVIYFALEDNRRRIQERMRLMLAANQTVGSDALQVLTMEDKVENMDRGFLTSLRHTLASSAGHVLVIVDTLSKVRFSKKGNEALYDYDRRSIDPFTELCADYPNLTIVVVHHSRKSESDDPYDLASGTLGLTGAADGTFVLAFDAKNQVTVLHGTGRDIEPVELAVKLNPPRWEVLGEPDDVGMGDSQRDILEALRSVGTQMTMREIEDVTGLPKTNVQGLLTRMVKNGKLIKLGKKYVISYPQPPEQPL
jgi:hypothetical protein